MAEIEVHGTEGEGTRFEGKIGNKVFEDKVSIFGSRDKVGEDKGLNKGLGGKGDVRVKESREMFAEGKVERYEKALSVFISNILWENLGDGSLFF